MVKHGLRVFHPALCLMMNENPGRLNPVSLPWRSNWLISRLNKTCSVSSSNVEPSMYALRATSTVAPFIFSGSIIWVNFFEFYAIGLSSPSFCFSTAPMPYWLECGRPETVKAVWTPQWNLAECIIQIWICNKSSLWGVTENPSIRGKE